jgi:hypothetical protein
MPTVPWQTFARIDMAIFVTQGRFTREYTHVAANQSS